jgi:hypothetical protein
MSPIHAHIIPMSPIYALIIPICLPYRPISLSVLRRQCRPSPTFPKHLICSRSVLSYDELTGCSS